MDVVIAAVLLVLLAPVMVSIAMIVRVTSRGPAIFRQTRVGLFGQPFEMLKFRSMRATDHVDDAALRAQIARELAGVQVAVNGSFKLPDDPRITAVGRVLRRTSLDELPQLINVLRGEMALVGPRPALPWEHEMFPTASRVRVAVPPGITGLWQVSGRSALDTRAMLELDVEYVRTRSWRGDLRILAQTGRSIVGDRSAR